MSLKAENRAVFLSRFAAHHRQLGAVNTADFARLHDVSLSCVWKHAASGFVLGAVQDIRSKGWWFYPGAVMLPFNCQRWKLACWRPRSDVLTLAEFAAAARLPKVTVYRYALNGLIAGVVQDRKTRNWWVYPPAELIAKHKPRRAAPSPGVGAVASPSPQGNVCATPYRQEVVLPPSSLWTDLICITKPSKQAVREAQSGCGKLPPSVRAVGARRAGFPTACAERSSDITEARAGAHGFTVGIPEGGNSPAPSVSAHGEPAFSLPGAFAVDVEHVGRSS